MLSAMTSVVDTAVSQLSITQALLLVLMSGLAIRWAAQRKKKNLPPCPPTIPFLGNVLDLKNSTLPKKTKEWKEQYGPVVRFYTGLQPWVALGTIEAVTEAYTQKGSDFANRPHVASLDYIGQNGQNIAFSPYNDDLVYRRKIAMLAIRQYLTGIQHTDRIHTIVSQSIADMVANKEPFNPHPHLSHIIFNIIHDICFGYTFKIDDPQCHKLLNLFDTAFADISGYWEDYFPALKHFPTPKFRFFKKQVDFFTEYVQNHVRERRANFDESKVETLVDNILLAQKQIAEGEKDGFNCEFTDAQVGLLIQDVFAAGIDTSRQTLDWLFLNMAARPEVQKKIHDEIDSVVGDGLLSREHRLGLVYTEATIMEVMRLYPVVPVGLPHETLRDTQVGGYDIPAKTQVVANQQAIMRDPAHWEKPEVFMPERFMEKSGTKLKPRPKSWIPFSIGPRSCIGEFLARTTVLYTVASILQKLHFSLPPGTKDVDFTAEDKYIFYYCKPYKVVVTKRE